MCSISHLKQTTQVCRHRVKMYGLKDCDHHVLAPDTDQINRIKLVQELTVVQRFLIENNPERPFVKIL